MPLSVALIQDSVFGGVSTSGDWSGNFNTLIASTYARVYVEAGFYRLDHQIDNIERRLRIDFEGRSAVTVQRNYTADATTGVWNIRGATGVQILGGHQLTKSSGVPDGGVGIFARSLFNLGCSGLDLGYVEVAPNFRIGVWLKGDENFGGSGAPGLRKPNLEYLNLFGGSVGNLLMEGVLDPTGIGLTFSDGSSTKGEFSGGMKFSGSSNVPSQFGDIRCTAISGPVKFDHANKIYVWGPDLVSSVSRTSNTVDCQVNGVST